MSSDTKHERIKIALSGRFCWLCGMLIFIIVSVTLWLRLADKTAVQSMHLPLVRAERVGYAAEGNSFSYAGEVRARMETALAFQVSGKITDRQVEIGDVVHAGDILMIIDPKDIRESVNSADATVLSARSQQKLAEVNLERYRKLHENGAVSKAELDRAQTAYETAAANLSQALAGYHVMGNQLDYSRLVAHSSGVIAEVGADAGQVIAAGQKVITLVQDNEKEIEINVPENRLDELQNTQNIAIRFWSLPDLTAKGRIREVSPIADKVARTYKVRISILDAPQQVKLGMTAKVSVSPRLAKRSMYIPLSAIYQTGEAPSVWVIKDGKVYRTTIRVGKFSDNKIEVLSGLEDGALLVTAGVHKLQEGQSVRISGERP